MYSRALVERLATALVELGNRPMLLASVAVLASQFFTPYAGYFHDAILYGGQVLNRVTDGGLSDDLFFQHGSQDRFSLFSPVLALPSRVLGVPAVFAVGYCLGIWLFAYALARLVDALFERPFVTALAVLVLVLAPQPYGAMKVFFVPERGYLTPRLPATGLALLGVAAVLRERFFAAAGWLALAMVTHPLIGFGPLCVAILIPLERRFGVRFVGVTAALALVGLAAVVAVEPWGVKLFGSLDPEWKQTVRRMTSYNFVANWRILDWVRLAFAFLGCGISAGVFADRRGTCRFFIAIGLVGTLGLAVFAVAGELPYALLLQGQSYRALWLPQSLVVPGLLAVATRWWARGPTHRLAGVILLAACVHLMTFQAVRAVLFLLASLGCVLRFRGVGRIPGDPEWGWKSVLAGFLVVEVLWNLVVFLGSPEFANWPKLLRGIHLTGLILRLGAVGLLLSLLAGLLHRRPRMATIACLAAAVLVQAGFLHLFAIPDNEHAQTVTPSDVEFVRDFLRDESTHRPDRRPTILWSSPMSLWRIWHDVGANSYIHVFQGAGVIYSRETAREVVDRSDRVAPLTIDELRRDQTADDPSTAVKERLLGGRLSDPEPTEADLRRVASDPVLDYIVIRREFPGLFAKSNGRWFIYDARMLRESGKK